MNEAIERWRKSLDKNPNNSLAMFSLAKALFDLGDFAQARDHFQKAIALKPDWMAAQILLGKCELSLGNKSAATAAFEKARQLAIDQNHEGPLAEMEQALEDLQK
jgi:tetratricopeptide (TPR) repeat protein